MSLLESNDGVDAEFLARGIQIVGKAVQGLRPARTAQAEEIIDQVS
jgi:hypothetical protein